MHTSSMLQESVCSGYQVNQTYHINHTKVTLVELNGFSFIQLDCEAPYVFPNGDRQRTMTCLTCSWKDIELCNSE